MERVRLNEKKIRIAMINGDLRTKDVAHNYGASKQRIAAITNSKAVTVETADKLARALGVDVLEIIE